MPNVVVGMRRAKDGRERSSPDRYVRTGKRGDFRFQGVEPGRYVIFANSRTHGTLLIPDVDVLPGKERFITLRFGLPTERRSGRCSWSTAQAVASKSHGQDSHAGAPSG